MFHTSVERRPHPSIDIAWEVIDTAREPPKGWSSLLAPTRLEATLDGVQVAQKRRCVLRRNLLATTATCDEEPDAKEECQAKQSGEHVAARG
jgi:hypothetical protein